MDSGDHEVQPLQRTGGDMEVWEEAGTCSSLHTSHIGPRCPDTQTLGPPVCLADSYPFLQGFYPSWSFFLSSWDRPIYLISTLLHPLASMGSTLSWSQLLLWLGGVSIYLFMPGLSWRTRGHGRKREAETCVSFRSAPLPAPLNLSFPFQHSTNPYTRFLRRLNGLVGVKVLCEFLSPLIKSFKLAHLFRCSPSHIGCQVLTGAQLVGKEKLKHKKHAHEQIWNNKRHIHVVEENIQHKTVNIKTHSAEYLYK